MARRRTAGKAKRVQLTAEQVEVVAVRMMAAAQAHQRASGWCMDKPDAKPPNIDAFFFGAVSFELILLSVEQSLRLLLLLNYSILRDDTNHSSRVLYKTIKNRSCNKSGPRQDISDKMKVLAQGKNIDPICEKELETCLRKHDSSYSNFRYFQLNPHGGLNEQFEFSRREVQVLHCLALALIHLNKDEMGRRDINPIQSMRRVPESEMTEELKTLKDRIASGGK